MSGRITNIGPEIGTQIARRILGRIDRTAIYGVGGVGDDKNQI